MSSEVLVEVENLSKRFEIPVRGGTRVLKAVDGVSFAIKRGTTLGIVGESGSGKSTVCRMLLLLEEPSDGQIKYDGQTISDASREWLISYRRRVQAVFQDPFSSLNPRLRVWEIVCESLLANRLATRAQARAIAPELLEKVGLPGAASKLYPHEFSGGQRQRISLARSLACSPELIVLDEAVSALDVSVRAQVLNLLSDLKAELGITYVLVTHDIAVAEHMSDDLAVMYFGSLVETGRSDVVCRTPKHPYTQLLMRSVLSVKKSSGPIEEPSDVSATQMTDVGCRFRSRCPLAMPRCNEQAPALRSVEGHGFVACHLY